MRRKGGYKGESTAKYGGLAGRFEQIRLSFRVYIYIYTHTDLFVYILIYYLCVFI